MEHDHSNHKHSNESGSDHNHGHGCPHDGGHKHQSDHGHHHGHKHAHGFSDVERWTQVFDSPDRDAYQHPELVLNTVGVKSDSISVDIGGGTGYFPIKIAKASPQGRVYRQAYSICSGYLIDFSCDTTPEMTEFLKKRVAENNFTNIVPIQARPDDPMIPEPVDFIFLLNTYHHIEDRVNYCTKLKSKLKPHGKIVNIDWKPGQSLMGPPEGAKLTPEQATEEFVQAGFKLVDQPDLPTPYNYTLVYGVSQ